MFHQGRYNEVLKQYCPLKLTINRNVTISKMYISFIQTNSVAANVNSYALILIRLLTLRLALIQ